MLLRAETRVDRSTAAIAVERSARDGVVHLRAPLTWIGVRTYRDAATGKLTRELRRPEQVWSASHVETLKRLTCTHGHPSESWRGETLPVMLDARADAGSGPGEDGTLRRPPAAGLQVGQTGDLIERVEIDGAPLPVAGVAIHGAAAIADIEAGKTQTSLGYGCLVDHTPGTWTDSSGRAWDYDAEHVLDVNDPRVAAAVAEGFDASTLGANHLAVAISRGRGGPMSELLPRLDSWLEDEEPAPVCATCKARDAAAAARVNEDAAPAPYPFGVRTIFLPARAKGLADKVAPLLASKVVTKADGLELNIPPDMAAPIADLFMAMAEQIKGMSGELMEADALVGEQAAELATAKEAAIKLAADAELVAPLVADARKAKRDALIVEATRVAGGKLDIADDLDAAGIRKAAVAKRLGAAFPRIDSVDAVESAFLALSTAGGKDPEDKPKTSKPKLDVLPLPERPTHAPTPSPASEPLKLSGLYLTDDDE